DELLPRAVRVVDEEHPPGRRPSATGDQNDANRASGRARARTRRAPRRSGGPAAGRTGPPAGAGRVWSVCSTPSARGGRPARRATGLLACTHGHDHVARAITVPPDG